MTTMERIIDSITDLRAGRISLEDFKDWIEDLSWDESQERQEVRTLLYQIRTILAGNRDDLDDSGILRALARISHE